MKKLSYLFAIVALFAFTSCGGSSEQATEANETVVEEAIVAEKVGCQAGEPCLEDHSCCVKNEEDTTGDGHEHEGHDHDHEH
jgi:hypothetical protein